MNTLRRKRRKVKNIQAGSMADIAFLLLLFFLVATTIVEDQGILVKLPKWEPHVEPVMTNTNNVLSIVINANNNIMVRQEPVDLSNLKVKIKEFIANPHRKAEYPKSPKKAIISLKNDTSTSYERYIHVYNEIKKAYNELRNEKSIHEYQKPIQFLNKSQKKAIYDQIPVIISEQEPSTLGSPN